MVLTLLLSFIFVGLGYCDTTNRWGQTDTYSLLKRTTPYDWVYLGHSRGGVSAIATDITTLPVGYSVLFIICASSSKTLPDAEPGKMLTLIATDDDDSGAVTITPTTSTGWASVSFDANGETVILQYIDSTYGWVIVGYSGATITAQDIGDKL